VIILSNAKQRRKKRTRDRKKFREELFKKYGFKSVPIGSEWRWKDDRSPETISRVDVKYGKKKKI
jgi:hypothetical protein